ncbi:MAG: hypothetical protein BA863_04215 [Desulfovibrio sp. S3730MH75]|nr:MAG: hypothetical protein BA863_04215 [Desulfovibrio sp. S3730MH75]
MAVDILIIRNKCDSATTWTNWIGEGLKAHLEGKGYSVTDLSDTQASPENVNYWLNYSSMRTKKLVIGLDHGSCSAFYGEKNNATKPVITKTNAEELTKELHVYTFACSTSGNNCIGQTTIEKSCNSWLGYTEPVYVIASKYMPLKECIWSYIDALAAGKTLEQAEAILRKAYKDRFSLHWIFKYNHDRLLLRKKKSGMTINSDNRTTKWHYNKKITGLYAYGPASRYAHVYVQGLGWKRIWPDHDSQVGAMMTMAAHAKSDNRNVTFHEQDNKIRIMYVW